ncbi:Protein of unknown function [Azotobacter beijerinckii]|uniref:DUF2790 domain-containing protein n=2 Tax=Azotobacter beijerinckii TaxID=170623 RepID=A0A1H6Z379_9GAMM|nr:Protein of unknown function [Azotobacter beijerinckii]
MKRLAALMMAAASFMAMSNIANAAEKEPDPLTADIQLVAPHQSANDEKTVDSHDYQYGDKPDVHKVISVKSNPMACGVTPAVMTYEDSHGEIHIMRYQIMGSGCQNG